MDIDAQFVSRRRLLRGPLALAAAALLSHPLLSQAATPRPQITVWKTPYCGCCKEWVKHLQTNGFDVVSHDVKETATKRKELGLPVQYGSCHTASLDGYVLEGHVPAREIRRLLKERPAALGLAVPGMPVGSPGMEVGTEVDAYDVVLVNRDGTSRVYQKYAAKVPVKGAA